MQRDTPQELVVAKVQEARVISRAQAATKAADRAVAEVRRLDRAPH